MKFDDKLAQLAFGDLSPEEARRIEAQANADPEAARMLDTYRSMKAGLRDLAEAPDDDQPPLALGRGHDSARSSTQSTYSRRSENSHAPITA